MSLQAPIAQVIITTTAKRMDIQSQSRTWLLALLFFSSLSKSFKGKTWKLHYLKYHVDLSLATSTEKKASQNYPEFVKRGHSKLAPTRKYSCKKRVSLSSRRKSTNSQWRKKRKCIIVKPLAEAADVALMVTSSHHASTYFYFDHLGREYFKPRVVDYLISVHLWPVLCQPWRTEIHVIFWGWGTWATW